MDAPCLPSLFSRLCLLAMLVSCVALTASGCGYLDDDILLSDEMFDETFSVEGMALYGSSHSSSRCGGGSYGIGRRASVMSFEEMIIEGERSMLEVSPAAVEQRGLAANGAARRGAVAGQPIEAHQRDLEGAGVAGWGVVFVDQSERRRDQVLHYAGAHP
ncbi:MAG: hypothetical protein H0U74_15975 [Bradymonadaceae bacterium]|nr:hypothetical protein [Lujinxingiaceae bacterium]